VATQMLVYGAIFAAMPTLVFALAGGFATRVSG
jgi:hypothetical protein